MAEGIERMTFEDLHVFDKNHKIMGPRHLADLAGRAGSEERAGIAAIVATSGAARRLSWAVRASRFAFSTSTRACYRPSVMRFLR